MPFFFFFFFFFLSQRKHSYVEEHSVKPGEVLLDRSPTLITKSFGFRYIGMNKVSKNKHYQIILFFLSLFILRERERAHKWGRGRKKGRERIPSKPCAVSTEPNMGLDLTNLEIMT